MGRLVKIDDSKRGAAVYQSTVTAPRTTASTAPTAAPRTVSGTEAAKSLQASIDAVRKSRNHSFERSGKTRDAYDSSVRSSYQQRQQGLLEQATADYRETNKELQGNTLKMLGIYSIGKALDKDISQSETLEGLVQRQDELQRQKTAMLAENPELKDPGALERIGKTVSGAIKQWGASNANSAATQYAAGSERRNTETDERLKEAQEGLARYQKLYQEALAEGDPNGDAGNYKNMIDHYQRQVDAFQQVPEAQQGAARESMQLADTLAASGAGDIQRAKQGAGKFGQTMVDVGAAGTQMAADMLAGKALGTKTSVPMMFRSFGGAAQEARQDGATIGEQMAYGATSAAVSGLTEQLSNVSKLFKGAFGKGVADDLVDTAIDKAVKRFAATEGGKTILRSGLQLGASAAGEGFEEMVEDIVNPMVKLIYQAKGQDPYGILSRTYAENFDLEETLYDGLIGAAMGLIGGTPEAIKSSVQGIRGNTESTGGYNPDAPTDIGQIIDDVRAKGAQTNPAMERVLDSVNEVVDGQKDSAASGSETKRPIQMEDFRNNDSSVWTMLDYDDVARQNDITQTVRQQMIDNGAVVELSGEQAAQYYPDLRSMKKSERTPILKQKINALKQSLRTFLSGLKDSTFEFDVNDNILEARLYDTGIREVLEKLTQEKAGMLYGSDAIFRNARYLYSTPDYAGDPNIYRWNYFYTPVSIDGGEPVGVRIAVRDLVESRYGEPQSQIYNWNIKKNAPLDGGQRGAGPDQPGVSSGAFSNAPLDGGSPSTRPPSSGISSGAFSEETLDGERRGQGRSSLDASSASSRDSVPQSQAQYNPNFNQNQGGDTGSTESVGAAEAGFDTRQYPGQERTSRLADSFPYNQTQEYATGLGKEDYDRIFRYESQSEAKSLHLAEELVYVLKDGRKTFLKDVDEAAFQGLLDSLDEATAWNGPQADAARMIESELKGRSVNGEIDETAYIDWMKTIREHSTATGQGVQANAKWERTGQDAVRTSELDAWENLEKSRLSAEEKKETFRRIVEHDQKIDRVTEGDTNAMKEIILDVAKERGVLSGVLGKQSKILESIVDRSLNALTFEQLKGLAYASTSAMSQDAAPASWGQKFKTIQVLNMLSSPRTAAKNLTGNTTFYGLDAAAMRGGTLLDMAISQLTGTRSMAMERGALSKSSLSDAAKAMQMAIAEITLDVNMDGETSRYGTSSQRTFKANGNLAERALSAVERNMAYLLNATDEFYKGAARGTAERTQSLIDQGKIKTTDADYAKNRAEELAKYRTFQDDTRIAAAIQTVHDVLNLVGLGDSGKTLKGKKVAAFGLGDIVAPFTRVAGNLVSRGLEYSPLNAAKGAVEITRTIANAARGNVDAAAQYKGVSDFARGMTGTAVAYGFMALAKAGLIKRADDEDDKDVQALNRAEGMTGSQFNLDAALRWLSGGDAAWRYGDELVDLSSIEPLNLLMNLGVEMAKDEGSPVVSMFTETGTAMAQAAGELPVMQFIGNTATDVLKYGQPFGETIAQEAGNTLISSLIPNSLRAVAKGLDDRPRNVYSGESWWENVADSAKNSIPGLRQTLPGSVDGFGNDKTYQGSGIGRLLDSLFNPVGVNTYQQGNVSKELERVREATGSTSIYPNRSASASVKYDNQVYEMTAEQRNEYQRTYGTLCQEIMASVTDSEAYRKMEAEQQAQLLSDITSLAADAAKAEILEQRGVDYTSSKWDKAFQAVDAGVELREYMTYRSILNATKAGDSPTQAEAAEALEQSGDLTTEIKGKLWQLQNSQWSAARNPYTGTLAQAGIDADTALEIVRRYNEIDKLSDTDDSVGAKEKATEFSKWLDGLGLTDRQRSAVDDTYKYWTFIPAESRAYDYKTMSETQKKVWDNWADGRYDMDEFIRLYGIMNAAGKKDDAVNALAEAMGSRVEARRFYEKANKKYD